MKNRKFLSIVILSFLSLFLIAVRIIGSNNWAFIFLVKNLFLAWIPFGFICLANKFLKLDMQKWRLRSLLALLACIAFLPNSFYIITDLIHINDYTEIKLWYDPALIFVTAFAGMSIGLYSMYILDTIIRRKFSSFFSWTSILGLSFLLAYGIYLGRYLRLNSWEIASDPFTVVSTVISTISSIEAIKTTLLFGCILFVGYISFLLSTRNKTLKNI
ncbi:MAG: DUF1361 domain-containing protein [Leadbetterella sp.]